MEQALDPISIEPIGVVRNGVSDVRRVDWSRVESRIELRPELVSSLVGLEGFSHLIVVGWLDQIPAALRERRQAHPGGDERLPLLGALALRGGARPNPISVTVCRLRGIADATIEVGGLDLVDGTPVLDVKPYVAEYDAVPDAELADWAKG